MSTPDNVVGLNPRVQRDFVAQGNDIVGHRVLLKQLTDCGVTRCEIPVSWVEDLLTEIEQLRDAIVSLGGRRFDALVGPEFLREFLHRIGSCHACGASLYFDRDLPHCMDCPSDCGDCDEEHEPLTDAEYRRAVECARRIQDGLPVIDRLQERLEAGCTIAFQDGLWWLFLPDGNGVVSGITLKKMLFELIFVE